MTKLTRLILVLVLILSTVGMSATGTYASQTGGNGKGNCPSGTTPFHDEETGVWLCQHGTVTLANGHPAYDEKAACTPGETREFKVPLKKGGFRIVRQTCNGNYHGPEGDHSPKHIVTGY